MWRYIVAHWRGQQSMPRSVLVNWLLVYILLLLLAGLVEVFAIRLADPVVWALFGAMLVWLAWAIVGILRRGWLVLADPDASILRKGGAVAAVLGAAVFAIVAAGDVYRIFTFRSVPRGPEIKSAWVSRSPSAPRKDERTRLVAVARWISTRRDLG